MNKKLKKCLLHNKKTGEWFVEHKGQRIKYESKTGNPIDEIEEAAKKANKSVDEYLDEIAESKKIRKNLVGKVPGVKEFAKWFDELTISEFEFVWKDLKLRNKIKRRLRHPGKLHEWLMVSRANTFKKWGKGAEDIWNLRTKISEVIFKNPAGVHGGKGSTKAHNEILELIDGSDDYDEFVKKLIKWSDNRLQGGSQKLPRGFFN